MMIPYGRQSINNKDIQEVVKVLKSDFLTQGPKIPEFEKSLAKYCGCKFAVVFK
jgi:dTDP-4-amino-4,6-dideoxygalactose transaminase